MADVFISYKREDRKAAELVDARLRAEGFTTWWDTSLVAGDHWSETINAELDTAGCVVVLWSERSYPSRWVQAEAHSGFERDLLVAGRLDAVKLKPPFNIVQTADLRDPAGLEQIVSGVRRKLGRPAAQPVRPAPPPPQPVSPPPPPPRSVANEPPTPFKPPRWALAAGAIAALALLAIFVDPNLVRPPPAGEVARVSAPEGAIPPQSAPPTAPPQAGEQTLFLDARTTPASTRAPLVRNPESLPDYALFRECDGCPEMVVIPGGSFLMGSPAGEAGRGEDEDSVAGAGGGQVRVSVGRFAISRFETTWDEWEACVAAGVCQQGPADSASGDNGWGRGRRPVIEVDWNDAGVFARWVNGRASVSAYRRPSEAEWEYAGRAGTQSRWSFGDAESQLGTYAWFTSNSGGRTQPVGGKAANPWGLFDMHGNVWEWVEDCYRDDLSGQTAAAHTTQSCSLRVLRGGSWNGYPQYLRSADRVRFIPTFRVNNDGFRLARTL